MSDYLARDAFMGIKDLPSADSTETRIIEIILECQVFSPNAANSAKNSSLKAP